MSNGCRGILPTCVKRKGDDVRPYFLGEGGFHVKPERGASLQPNRIYHRPQDRAVASRSVPDGLDGILPSCVGEKR